MQSLCLNRISKDLKELSKSPLEGIGIVSLDNDPMKYVVNMKILTGIFEGYCLQLLLTFPDKYPIKPPTILIYPGQYFDNTYHHHIFESNSKDEEGKHFNKFCFDLLQNDFLSTNDAYTGWNPSYSITTLLLQVQIFLSKPDFPNGYIPEKERIDELMKSMDGYEKPFKIKNDKNEEIIKVHTWKNPYPEMYFKTYDNTKFIEIEKEEDKKLKEIKENLTCFISRLNFIDNKNFIPGYPIRKIGYNRIIAIPEILSYDCFIEESSKNDSNRQNSSFDPYRIYTLINQSLYGDDTFNNNEDNINNDIMNINAEDLHGRFFGRLRFNYITFDNDYIPVYFDLNRFYNYSPYKSANNEPYDNWLPIYINDEHFEKNKTTILNYFSIIKYGKLGLKKFDFQPEYIFDVLPNLLTEIILKMSEGNISSAILKCFFQYALMFKKFERKYNNIFRNYQKNYLNIKIQNLQKIDGNTNVKKIIMELIIIFSLCDNEIDQDNKQLLDKIIKNLKNRLFFPLLNIKNQSFIIKEKLNEDLKKNKLDCLIKNQIIYRLEKVLIKNFGIKYIVLKNELNINHIINQIYSTNPLALFSELNETEKDIFKITLLNNSNISEYFDINQISKKISFLYPNMNLNQVSSKFISLLDFLKEKIFSNNFLNELEKNFGVCLDTEKYIEELKIKTADNLDILKKYEMFSILDISFINIANNALSIVNREKRNYSSYIHFFRIFDFSYNPFTNGSILYKIYNKSMKLLKEQKRKSKNEKAKMKYKEKIRRDKYNIKNSYSKNNNKRFTKYIIKKNINRLLLFKRYHY